MFVEKIKVHLKCLIGFFRYAGSLESATHYKTGDSKYACDAVVVIAAHGRSEILQQVIHHLTNFKAPRLEVCLSVVVCVSRLKDAELLRDVFSDNEALHIIQCANLPLGNKWQQAVNYAKSLNPKALIVCGSDDLLSYSYLLKCLSFSDDERDFCGPKKWHMIDNESDVYKVHYKTSKSIQVLGSGRVYSKVFLDKVNWRLFDRYLNSGLDYRGLSMVKKKGKDKLHVIDSKFTVMSVKGRWDMLNSFDDIRTSCKLKTERLSADSAKRCIKEFNLQ